MARGIGRGVVALALAAGTFAQMKSGEPIDAVHISGRIVASTGAPIPDRTVIFRNVTTNGRLQDSKLKTDDKGMFAFSLARGVVYQVNLTVAEDPLLFRGIGTIEVVEGQDVAMGDIVLESSPRSEPIVHLVGPIQIKEPQTAKARPSPLYTFHVLTFPMSFVPEVRCISFTVMGRKYNRQLTRSKWAAVRR